MLLIRLVVAILAIVAAPVHGDALLSIVAGELRGGAHHLGLLAVLLVAVHFIRVVHTVAPSIAPMVQGETLAAVAAELAVQGLHASTIPSIPVNESGRTQTDRVVGSLTHADV